MKRRSFILSIPLIGLVAKALAKPEVSKPFFNEKRLKERRDYLLKYPLTERECFKKSDDGSVLVWDENEQGFKELKAEIRGNTVIFKKDDDGKFTVTDPNTGESTKGNLLWTDDAEIKLI